MPARVVRYAAHRSFVEYAVAGRIRTVVDCRSDIGVVVVIVVVVIVHLHVFVVVVVAAAAAAATFPDVESRLGVDVLSRSQQDAMRLLLERRVIAGERIVVVARYAAHVRLGAYEVVVEGAANAARSLGCHHVVVLLLLGQSDVAVLELLATTQSLVGSGSVARGGARHRVLRRAGQIDDAVEAHILDGHDLARRHVRRGRLAPHAIVVVVVVVVVVVLRGRGAERLEGHVLGGAEQIGRLLLQYGLLHFVSSQSMTLLRMQEQQQQQQRTCTGVHRHGFSATTLVRRLSGCCLAGSLLLPISHRNERLCLFIGV